MTVKFGFRAVALLVSAALVACSGAGNVGSSLPTSSQAQRLSIGSTKPLGGKRHHKVRRDGIVSCPFAISANFNGTAIPAGRTIWFSAVAKAKGLGSSPATVYVTNVSVSFTANNTPYTVDLPDSTVTFDPQATSATITYNSANGWTESVPSKLDGNVLIDAGQYAVTSDLPGGIQNVTLSANVNASSANVTLDWAWSAATYSQFNSDDSQVGVKPVDDNKVSQYQNSDHAGTPENEKPYVVGGAMGGGGSNYTGGLSGTSSASLCQSLQDVYVVNACCANGNVFLQLVAPTYTSNTIVSNILPGGYGLAIDSQGNAWIGLGSSGLVEYQAVNGTLPPNPTPVYFGGFAQVRSVGVDKSNNVYVLNYVYQGCGYVSELQAVNGVVPPNQTAITLSSPSSCVAEPGGLAVDSNGNIFVGDTYNDRIAELVAVNGAVLPNSAFISVGSGWNHPYGVAVDQANNVYVADNGDSRIAEMLAVNGTVPLSPTIVTLGGGTSGPWDVAVDNRGNVFVADYGNSAVKEMPPGCSSAACVNTISSVPYVTYLAVH